MGVRSLRARVVKGCFRGVSCLSACLLAVLTSACFDTIDTSAGNALESGSVYEDQAALAELTAFFGSSELLSSLCAVPPEAASQTANAQFQALSPEALALISASFNQLDLIATTTRMQAASRLAGRMVDSGVIERGPDARFVALVIGAGLPDIVGSGASQFTDPSWATEDNPLLHVYLQETCSQL